MELAKISDYIVCELFRIAPQRVESGYTINNVNEALRKLERWELLLPEQLLIRRDRTNPDPACYNLYMAKNQLIILTTRPMFLGAVEQAIKQSSHQSFWSLDQHPHARYIRQCSGAAYLNMILGRHLKRDKRLLQADLHFIFNAAVILLINRVLINVLQRQAELEASSSVEKKPPEQDRLSEIQFALDVFESEARTGTDYPKDCYKVLRDLSSLVDHYVSWSPDTHSLHNHT